MKKWPAHKASAQADANKPVIRSVKFNVVMNMILTSSGFIFPLITLPYVSRVLGPYGIGIVSWIQTLIGYFILVAVLGITTYGVRACAQVRDNREELSQTTQELGVILLVSTSIAYLIYILCIFLIPKTRDNLALAFIFSAGIWLSSCGFSWFYQAIEQYGYITIRSLTFKVLGLVLMFMLIHKKSDYVLYGLTTVIAGYGSNIFNLIRLRKFVTFKHRKLNIRRHFRPMLSFTVSSLSSGMYSQMDMLMSGFFVSNTMLGLYQIVTKIRSICYTAVNSIGSVMLPRISYYEIQDGHDNVRKLVGKNINFIVLISLAIASLIVICAKPIILIFGGTQYLDACRPLQLAAIVPLVSGLNTTFTQYLIAIQKEKECARIDLLGLVLSVAYCGVLIPKFGILGAAISVLLCEISTLCVRSFLLKDFIKELRSETDVWKIVLSSVITFFVMWAFMNWCISSYSPFAQCALEGIAFLLIDGVILLLLHEKFICSFIPKPIFRKK